MQRLKTWVSLCLCLVLALLCLPSRLAWWGINFHTCGQGNSLCFETHS